MFIGAIDCNIHVDCRLQQGDILTLGLGELARSSALPGTSFLSWLGPQAGIR